jgi:hypothetical protein
MPFAVDPKRDCPHALRPSPAIIAQGVTCITAAACSVCGDASENWFDLLDGTVGCSREINGHALQHAQATSHALSVSFSDLSVWCYACDSYIVSPLLSELLGALSHAKHSPSPAHLSGGSGGGAAPPSPSEVCASAPRVQAFADSFAAARNVMVVLGAGASTSAGIPDFRTPGTGLYDNLQAYAIAPFLQ